MRESIDKGQQEELSGGKLVRQQRQLRKWSQADLAGKLDLSPTHVSAIERGKRAIYENIAKKLGEIFDLPHTRFLQEKPVHSDKDDAADVQRTLEKIGLLLENREFETAYAALELLCDHGIPRACCMLAFFYMEGIVIPRDIYKAVRLLQENAQGPTTFLKLAELLEMQFPSFCAIEEAMEIYETLLDCGKPMIENKAKLGLARMPIYDFATEIVHYKSMYAYGIISYNDLIQEFDKLPTKELPDDIQIAFENLQTFHRDHPALIKALDNTPFTLDEMKHYASLGSNVQNNEKKPGKKERERREVIQLWSCLLTTIALSGISTLWLQYLLTAMNDECEKRKNNYEDI